MPNYHLFGSNNTFSEYPQLQPYANQRGNASARYPSLTHHPGNTDARNEYFTLASLQQASVCPTNFYQSQNSDNGHQGRVTHRPHTSVLGKVVYIDEQVEKKTEHPDRTKIETLAGHLSKGIGFPEGIVKSIFHDIVKYYYEQYEYRELSDNMTISHLVDNAIIIKEMICNKNGDGRGFVSKVSHEIDAGFMTLSSVVDTDGIKKIPSIPVYTIWNSESVNIDAKLKISKKNSVGCLYFRDKG